jgi:hypothetical protein
MGSRPSAFTLTAPGKLRIYSTEEMMKLPAPTWLIDKIVPAGGLVGLYGAPGIKKSFVAADVALSIAAGGHWQGHPVTSGFPLYVCAEGAAGMGKRVKGFLKYRKLQPSQAAAAWLTESVPIYADSDGVETLLERIEEADVIPDLIVIDTLARCFDGDENQQLDMGRFVAGVDRLRKEFDATVLVVHHTRLDGDRERGNTAFRGAADAMLSLSNKKGKLTLSCAKMKDAEEFDDIELRLKEMPDEDTLVIVNQSRTATVAVKARDMLAVLNTLGPLSWDEWFSAMQATAEMPRSTFSRYLVGLRETGQIIKENAKYHIPKSHENEKEEE